MQTPRILAIAGLSLFVLSCGRSGPVRLRFDVGTTDDEKAIVQAVIPDWNAETLSEWQIAIDDEGDTLVSFVDQIIADGQEMDGRECTDEGEDCARGQWVRVRRGMTRERTVRVVRHELGHTLSDMHDLEGGKVGVMRAGEPADAITDADRALCRAAGACPMIRAKRID